MAASVASEEELSYEQAEAILQMMADTAVANPTAAVFKALSPRVDPVPMPPLQEPQGGDSRSSLWRADRRYRALIEQIPVVTFMAALDETIHELYVSPQIQTLLGFTQQEWLEDPFLWYNQLHPDDRERWQREFARTCTTGVDFKSEYRFLARDGRTVWVHGECQLIRDDMGQPLFLQGVAYDITESKRAEAELQRMHRDLEKIVQQRTAELARQTAELARSNMELSQFAYVASHDLQEPLRMMASFAQLLSERYQGKLDSDADEFIHFITDGATRMQRLINDLLLYSRAGRGEIATAPVDFNTVLELACANLRAVITEKNVSITADRLPVVIGNDALLVQLLQNLIGNAIKFARPNVRSEVHVGVKREDKEWVFSVRDNGIGFDPQHAERIFLIFQRLHPRVEYPGTGIGLSICRKIVERHYGRIWAESVPGSGSTFCFTLPAAEAK
jgi:PAS domain S-box-containing protein